MIPAPFEYLAPTTIEEAIALLGRHGDDAKVLAGGHSLLPLMKLRLAAPAVLIDLGGIPGLQGIRDHGDQIAIGAMTRYVDLQRSSLLQERVPMLPAATAQVGDAQVRNRGTLGGALAHADPAGDMPAVAVALGGTIVASGPTGPREVPLADFFQDIFTSALAPDEIITEIRIDAPSGRAQRYESFRRRAADWATIGAAAVVTSVRGVVTETRVVLTNAGPTPMVAEDVAAALVGRPADLAAVQAAAGHAAAGLTPTADLNASSQYKRHLATVLTRRALEGALGLA